MIFFVLYFFLIFVWIVLNFEAFLSPHYVDQPVIVNLQFVIQFIISSIFLRTLSRISTELF